MKNLILAVTGYLTITALFLACNDENVKQVQDTPTSKIFAVDVGDGDTTYLRQFFISNSAVFFVCNKQGKPLAGTSAWTGKTGATVIMQDTVRDTIIRITTTVKSN